MTVGDLKREVAGPAYRDLGACRAAPGPSGHYVHGYADADGGALAGAALRVFAEQSDLVRGRELTMLAVGEDLAGLRR